MNFEKIRTFALHRRKRIYWLTIVIIRDRCGVHTFWIYQSIAFEWLKLNWIRLIVSIDWNSIRWMWSISNNSNELMMSMKYETDTVHYVWYFDAVAILVVRSRKKRAAPKRERERKENKNKERLLINLEIQFFFFQKFCCSVQWILDVFLVVNIGTKMELWCQHKSYLEIDGGRELCRAVKHDHYCPVISIA